MTTKKPIKEVAVAMALVERDGKLLIMQRRDSNPMWDKKWEFPGGKLNAGETLEKCIKREIREELEIEIEILEKLTAVNHNYVIKQIQLIPFLCILKSGKINLTEHNDLMWVTIGNLKNVDFAGADKKLIQLKANKEILKKYLGENMNDSG